MPKPWTALALHEVSVIRGGRPIISGLSFHADEGKVTALLGPNGVGKTTTVRCCSGLLRPTSGTVEVAGGSVSSAVARGAIGLMPQATGAWSGIRTGELLAYLATLYAHPHTCEELQELLALSSIRNTPYRRLSRGEQQLVNFAAAIIGRPAVLFLDEPTAGLDPHARRRVWDAISALRSAGTSIVLTTHSMDEVSRLADHVWIMNAGRIAANGTVAELTTHDTLEEVYLMHTGGEQ